MTNDQRSTPLFRPASRLRASLCALLLAGLLLCSGFARPAQAHQYARAPAQLLSGDFLAFWKNHNGPRELGLPLSAPIWLDGRVVQLFAHARLERGVSGVTKAALPDGWWNAVPADLRAYAAAPLRASVAAPGVATPLTPITVTLTVPGYSGPAELRIYDGQARPAGAWPVRVQKGAAAVVVEGRGSLGAHQALVLIGGRIAGVNSRLFTLDAQTTVETGQARFDDLYPQVRDFMSHDVLEYALNGQRVHGYRSPDNDLLWLRDHTYQGRAFRYFDADMTSMLDAFRRAQRADGSFPDYLARPQTFVPAGREEVEADVEYLFVQAVYEAWQATGNDSWLRTNLDAMRRGLRYTMTDPLRWDAEHRLVKRPFTIDTWDFQYGPTTSNPTNGAPAPRHWIDKQTIWGIFHGDNTGLASSLLLLANIEEHLGNSDAAARWRAQSDGIMQRLNALSWNGHFFTHQIHLTPFSAPGVDESQQLSLSNAYALNRGILSQRQARAIVDEYYHRFQTRGAAFAEWYSIDPPFPADSFGLAGNTGERPGEYVNGGIMPLVGGELARGAFRVGAESYAFDILARYHFLVGETGASYLWYYPAGNPGKSNSNTLPTDGWGASAMLGALLEGAAGVVDQGARYQDVQLSPRWAATDDVRAAYVVTRYAASDGYLAYRWQRADRSITLNFTGSGEHAAVRLLLPAEASKVAQVTLDGVRQGIETEKIFSSQYVLLDVKRSSGQIKVTW